MPRPVFLTTTKRGEEYIAIFGDQDILGEAGIEDLHKALRAGANPMMRKGVLTISEEHIERRLRELRAAKERA